MQALPHRYEVGASGGPDGSVAVFGIDLPLLATWPPAQFDGRGDYWSPETLLLAAVADCYVLTFRALARATKLAWVSLDCQAEGVLDRKDRTLQFVEISLTARLVVPKGVDHAKALADLHRAEQQCLVSNSLLAKRSLAASVESIADAALGDPA